ncbi:uncharacterized protein LOC114078308 [Solanum pennellii]|uniref:Uncharacterized protein LOC114078308 n=1 Tax=Solanum pennellii TaxID=28526 RepID=A0ABM1VG51_SOLPN|nr:uncharacterized protein LOC114078308 [Solanum pennellii]
MCMKYSTQGLKDIFYLKIVRLIVFMRNYGHELLNSKDELEAKLEELKEQLLQQATTVSAAPVPCSCREATCSAHSFSASPTSTLCDVFQISTTPCAIEVLSTCVSASDVGSWWTVLVDI